MSTMALLLAVIGVAPAWAAEPLVLDADQSMYGEEGSTYELAELAVDADRIGDLCTLQVHTENQFSVHPGNDLLVTTGGAQTVIEDVEAEPDAGRDLSAGIVLGPVLLVELRFGADQLSSMGFDLSVDCATTAPIIIETEPCSDPLSGGASTPAASDGTDCQEPTPVTEVQVPLPPLPAPCGNGGQSGDGGSGGDGSLTVSTDGCDEPATTTTAPPTTTPSTTAPAAVQSTATAAPSTTGPTPTVQGLQITRQLPQTPAASPVQAAPAYTG